MNHFLLPGLTARRNALRLGSLVLKLAFFLPLPAFCQGRAISVAQIPFGFVADGKALPAGEYVLYRDAANIYSLRTQRGVLARRLMTYNDAAATEADTSKLVFRAVVDGYQLESFCTGGSREAMRVINHHRRREEVAMASVGSTFTVAFSTPFVLAK